MSSDEDWTHQWLMTNMGPSVPEETDDAEVQNTDISLSDQFAGNDHPSDSFEISRSHAEGLSTSPVTSIDFDRESPMGCAIDDDEADDGPPSIETQPPDNSDLEVSEITASWLKSTNMYENQHGRLNCSPVDIDDMPCTSGLQLSHEAQNSAGGLGDDFCVPTKCADVPGAPFNSPTAEQQSIEDDIADIKVTGGLCGLRNLGNTCFMAAGLQCLVNTPPIAQYFFNHNFENESKWSLAGSFSQLTHKIWSGKYSSLRPLEFKEAFGAQWRDFKDYRQHDCQEFMTLLLEGLRKQMLLKKTELLDSPEPMDHSDTADVPRDSNHRNSVGSSGSSSGRGVGHPSTPGQSPPATPASSPGSPSPISIDPVTQPYESRTEIQEDQLGLDSGPTSPKSSISSGSVDSHLISLRLQPIPEEVKNLVSVNASYVSRSNSSETSSDCPMTSGNGSCDRVAAVRKYNHLNSGETAVSSTSGNIPYAGMDSTSNCQTNLNCDKFQWSLYLPKEDTNGVSSSVNDYKYEDRDSVSHLSMVKLEDIMKETKTSNVNVLAKDNLSNNDFLYDSEKYAKCDLKRINNSVDNLNRTGLKRVKEVNILVDKMDNSQIDSDRVAANKLVPNKTFSAGRNSTMSLNKRIRLEEKNLQYELERNQTDRHPDNILSTASRKVDEPLSLSASDIRSKDQQSACDSWSSFVGSSKSAVVDTFYGQFRNSLVCAICGYTSVKFDPFGTLSVPLPHANELQIPVVYVPSNGDVPTRYLVVLSKASTVQDLKESLIAMMKADGLDCENKQSTIVIAEVFDNHIARTVDNSHSTKFLNTSTRSIYAFEIVDVILQNNDLQEANDTQSCDEGDKPNKDLDPGNEKTDAQWQACNICLEELCQTELKTHDSCEDCALCDNCIEMSCKHHGGELLPCPVCHTQLNPSDLMAVLNRKNNAPKSRILRVPVVFRIDIQSDDNNKREIQLTGHPCLLSLPSPINTDTLVEIVKTKVMDADDFSLLLVDGRGHNCSRCLFSSHCRGCDVNKFGTEINLQAGDTLCVRFKQISSEEKYLCRLRDHSSVAALRANEPLTLYDCLRAFTQTEVLRENESWFCPKCSKKQHATKQISVWKFPPYLIIHLERFLFNGTASVKLDDKVLFPINGLDLTDFVSGQPSDTPLLYNLYSCVCHMGVAQAGHYTAFVQSPITGEWHYFNDDCVTKQNPRDDEYSTSYLLFYHRQGAKFDLDLPKNFSPSRYDLKTNEINSLNAVEGHQQSNCSSKKVSLPSASSMDDRSFHPRPFPAADQTQLSEQPTANLASQSPPSKPVNH